MSRLLSELFTLPLLPVRLGVEILQRTVEGFQTLGGIGLQASTKGTVRNDPPAPPVLEAPNAGSWNGPPGDPGGLRSAVGRPPTKEDRAMSCNCCGSDYCSCETSIECSQVTSDRGLGGRCCVKVVQYTVLSARSGVDDNDRIIVGPTTIAFSDDLDESSFTAWVISENGTEIERKVAPRDRKYLRVAYQVFARFAEEEPNYSQEQVAALWDIARRLPPPEEKSGGGGKAKAS